MKSAEKVLKIYSNKKYAKHCFNYERNFTNWHFHTRKIFSHGKFRQLEQQNTILLTMKVNGCLWAHIRAPELKSILIYHFRGAILWLISTLTVIFQSFRNINITNYKKKRKKSRFFMISAKLWDAHQLCNLSVDTLIEQFLDWIPQNTRKLKITALEFFG